MAINFPNSPSNGATHTAAGQTFTYDGTAGVWNPQEGTPVSTGTSAPSSPAPGDLWFDTASGTLYFYYADGSSNQWVGVTGPTGAAGANGTNGADGADATLTSYTAQGNLPTSGNTVGTLAWLTSTDQLAIAESAQHWSIFSRSATTDFFATGGTITTYTGDGTNGTNGTVYKVHTFTSSGNFVTSASKSFDYIVVAGGGSGGPRHSGGGGAGGYIAQTGTTIAAGTHAIVIGAGGAGIAAATATGGNNGSNTTFNSHAAVGGGSGAYSSSHAGGSGGSGGGSSSWNNLTNQGSGTSGQGYAGAPAYWDPHPADIRIGGGGGGASEVGETPSATLDGAGGDGIQNYINGTGHYWAGGGGGGSWQGSRDGGDGGKGGGGGGGSSSANGGTGDTNALNAGGDGNVGSGINASGGPGGANTGGGSGAGGQDVHASFVGGSGNGGSGVVIIRYEA